MLHGWLSERTACSRPGRLVRRWLPGLAAAWLTACVAPDATPEWGGSVTDSAGIRIVHNPEVGLWAPGDEWTVVEAMTIGSDVGEPAYQFGAVTGVSVGPDGSIFVLDGMAGELRVFDEGGSHVLSVGGRGEGPGELSRSASGPFLLDGQRLAVPDVGNGRINWLSLEGEHLGSVPTSYASGFPVRWDADGMGGVVVQRRAMGFNEDEQLEAGDPLVRIDDSGGESTLTLLPLARTVRMEGARPRFTYFETEPSWDFGASGTLRTAMTQEYRIELRDASGAIHTVVTRASTPRPVTSEDEARFELLLREALTRRGTAPDAVDRFARDLEFGPTFPAFNQIMEGPDRTTLVQRVQDLRVMESIDLSEEQSRRLASPTWDVFDPEGRFLGPVDLPARFTPLAVHGSALYGRWLDELDRPYVMKLEIVSGAGSP